MADIRQLYLIPEVSDARALTNEIAKRRAIRCDLISGLEDLADELSGHSVPVQTVSVNADDVTSYLETLSNGVHLLVGCSAELTRAIKTEAGNRSLPVIELS